jgi:hypothetical protein
MKNYPEITALNALISQFDISVSIVSDSFLAGRNDFPLIEMRAGNESFSFFVDDEFGDLALGNPPLSLCVALRTLESYEFAEDFLVWCTQHGLDAAGPGLLDHFKNLGEIYTKIQELLGEINSQISDFDFELNAGAVQMLRKSTG